MNRYFYYSMIALLLFSISGHLMGQTTIEYENLRMFISPKWWVGELVWVWGLLFLYPVVKDKIFKNDKDNK